AGPCLRVNHVDAVVTSGQIEPFESDDGNAFVAAKLDRVARHTPVEAPERMDRDANRPPIEHRQAYLRRVLSVPTTWLARQSQATAQRERAAGGWHESSQVCAAGLLMGCQHLNAREQL